MKKSVAFSLALEKRELSPEADDQGKGQKGGEQVSDGLGQLHAQNAVEEGGQQQDQREKKQALS